MSLASMRHEIGFLMFNYAPASEAVSQHVDLLFGEYGRRFGGSILAFNVRGDILRINGATKQLPALILLSPRMLVRTLLGMYGVNHLFASAGERFLLPKIAGKRTILSIAKSSTPERVERNFPHIRRMRYVVVESEYHRELMRQGGVSEDRIQLIYPGAMPLPYHPAPGPFTILFASSGSSLLSRGIRLLIHTARALPDVQFVIAWRKHPIREYDALIKDTGVRNVTMHNGIIADMGKLYRSAHATILPALHRESLKACPQSMLDSLAHGKPVLVSSALPVADRIERFGPGLVFEPTIDALQDAIIRLRNDYESFQPLCHPTLEATFSRRVFLERHERLYASILGR